MIQQPGCPNLYWALTDLPAPLVDLRKGVQGDRTIVAADLRLLHDDTPMTDAEIAKFVSHWSGRMGSHANRRASRLATCAAGSNSGCSDPARVQPPASAWSRPVMRSSSSSRCLPRRSFCWTRNAIMRSKGMNA